MFAAAGLLRPSSRSDCTGNHRCGGRAECVAGGLPAKSGFGYSGRRIGQRTSKSLTTCAIATYANLAPPTDSTRIVVAVIGTRLTRNRAEPTRRINDYGGYACRRAACR